MKGRTYTECVQERVTEENIGSYKGGSGRALQIVYSSSPDSLRLRKSSRVRLVDHIAGMEPLKMHAKCCQVTCSVGLDQHHCQQNCNQTISVATYIDLLIHIVVCRL
jgi:hypothetical protein